VYFLKSSSATISVNCNLLLSRFLLNNIKKMYPSGGGGNPNQYNQYAPPNQGAYGAPTSSKSPPPLQHPVPQHPIPDFGTAVHNTSSPSPNLQQQQYQQQYGSPMMHQQQQSKMHQQTYDPNAYTPQPHQHQQMPPPNSNLYSQFGFNDPAAQMGMQFAGSAMAQGSAYVEQNVSI
jgi:hypothetical protein